DKNVVYFVNDSDQGIYVISPGTAPKLIFSNAGLRFADIQFDRGHDRLVCICEDHRGEDEASNSLVSISLANKPNLTTLHRGEDLYASPTIRDDGGAMAWLCWNHPNMPWDGTELWLADVGSIGELQDATCIAGDEDTSIFQPQWSPDHQLYYVSDVAGWWQIYRHQENVGQRLSNLDADFGLPQWVFGQSTYGFLSSDFIACCYCQHGEWHLATLDVSSSELQRIDTSYVDITSVRSDGERIIFLAGSYTSSTELITYHPAQKSLLIVKQSLAITIAETHLSMAEKISFAAADGSEGYGFYYAPTNGDFEAPVNERPPLIVFSHGGPTAATSSSLNLKIQYWTSRGFAVFDINYGGSTGYGRAYRQRLNKQWGLVDVSDCERGAQFLAATGKVDGDRLIIRGGSAGGYTTLCALTFTDTFSAGASLYGIGDLEALVRDTHKFESRYLDRLVGPLPDSERIYRDRSPLFHADKLSCPVIFFQGDEDRVVPPNQAEAMVEALEKNNIAVSYLLFEGEQHGFRRAETITRVLEAELYFYGKVLGFKPAGDIEPVTIINGPT
ncbi:MAG: S9 family peptidase, partial [Acidiferrobacterales bacterium]